MLKINKAHKQYYSNNIARQSLNTTHYSHFDLPLPPSMYVANRRKSEFQIAKLLSSMLINLKTVSNLIECKRELRLYLLG